MNSKCALNYNNEEYEDSRDEYENAGLDAEGFSLKPSDEDDEYPILTRKQFETIKDRVVGRKIVEVEFLGNTTVNLKFDDGTSYYVE